MQSPYNGSLAMPFEITADFGTLATGTHTVTLWTAGNDVGNNCTTDRYPYKTGSETVLEVGK